MRKIYMGYDPAEAAGFHTCCHSIISRASQPLSIVPLALHLLEKYGVKRSHEDSTDFARTRFLAPWIEGTGKHSAEWILFMDGADMLVLDDICNLWKHTHTEFDKAVLVVKHQYKTKASKKMWNQDNRAYPMKNWSSVMLMNVRRCIEYLTPTYISQATGADLHQFKWLPDECLIGELPQEWNHLVGEIPTHNGVKVAHFTLGIPAIRGYEQQEFAKEWFDEFGKACSVKGI